MTGLAYGNVSGLMLIWQQNNDLSSCRIHARRRITAGHDDELLEAGFSKRKAEQDMFVYGIKNSPAAPRTAPASRQWLQSAVELPILRID